MKFRVFDIKRECYVPDEDLKYFFMSSNGELYSNQYGLVILNQDNYRIEFED